ncbi:SH3 domain-containing protein [Rhodobacteraceae bacterium KMM 6894]|nr:SH3 domain-containing protein [Rhodobacteraceae bacterium KMM 6894]
MDWFSLKIGALLAALALPCTVPVQGSAQGTTPIADSDTGQTEGQTDTQKRGSVTNLPLPRFVSMKASEGFVRRGPSQTHQIDWVFRVRDTPLEITAEHGHWRRVRDREGAGGWMHYSLLSGTRTVINLSDMLEIKAKPDEKSLGVAQLEVGVVARILECRRDWCRIQTHGYRGWALKSHLWGVLADEILD